MEVPSLTYYVDENGFGLYDITFNTTDGPFTDINLRKAVAYAINREEILQGGADGYGVVNNCWCATGCTGYLPDFEWYEQDLEKGERVPGSRRDIPMESTCIIPWTAPTPIWLPQRLCRLSWPRLEST